MYFYYILGVWSPKNRLGSSNLNLNKKTLPDCIYVDNAAAIRTEIINIYDLGSLQILLGQAQVLGARLPIPPQKK